MEEAQAVISPAEGKSFDPTKIPKAIKDAGFSPGPIEIIAVGKLTDKDELMALEMAGPVKQFVLAGGPKAEELKARSDLRGKRMRVTGQLHPPHADKPPGLTVEQFRALPE